MLKNKVVNFMHILPQQNQYFERQNIDSHRRGEKNNGKLEEDLIIEEFQMAETSNVF